MNTLVAHFFRFLLGFAIIGSGLGIVAAFWIAIVKWPEITFSVIGVVLLSFICWAVGNGIAEEWEQSDD